MSASVPDTHPTPSGLRRFVTCVMRPSGPRFLGLLSALAVGLRMAWLIVMANNQVSDSVQYKALATNLASGEGYTLNGQPNAFWPVGYPLFLSLVYRVCPDGDLAGKIANVVAGLGIVVLTYGIGRELIGEAAGRIAGLSMAVLPSQVAEAALLRTESLFLVLFLFAVWQILRVARQPGYQIPKLLVAGAAIGAACLVRPLLLPFPAVALIILLLRGAGWRKTAVAVIALGVAQSAVIAPWSLRNYSVYGTFVPVSTNGGYNLWIGNNPYATGTYLLEVDGRTVHSFDMRQELLQGRSWTDVEADEFFRARAMSYIKEYPDRFLVNGVKKLWYLYSLDTDAVNWSVDGSPYAGSSNVRTALKILAQGPYVVLMAVALLGAVSNWSRVGTPARSRWVLLIVVGFFTAIHGVTVADDRYHAPMIPFACCLAAVWLARPRSAGSARTHAPEPIRGSGA